MIKVLESTLVNDKEYLCTLYADTKTEVSGTSLVDFVSGAKLSAGSTVITGGWDVGILKSDGTWSWK